MDPAVLFLDPGRGPEPSPLKQDTSITVDPQLTKFIEDSSMDVDAVQHFFMEASMPTWDNPYWDGGLPYIDDDGPFALPSIGGDHDAAEEPLETPTSASASSSCPTDASVHSSTQASQRSSKSSLPVPEAAPPKPVARKDRSSKTAASTTAASAVRKTKPTKKKASVKAEPKIKQEFLEDSPPLLESSTPETGKRRTNFLERNRVAASKCRQKKKEWVQDLEETKGDLEAQHMRLQREYTSLLSEATEMKNRLMVHAGCNDANIDMWIENQAKKFVLDATGLEGDEYRRRLSLANSAGLDIKHSGMSQ
jgi:hypothetical protein